MFKNKRKYQYDQIQKWLKSKKPISKTRLSKKLGITRPTLNKLVKSVNDFDFLEYKRKIANNKISDDFRIKIFQDTMNFLEKINQNRKETKILPTFAILKPFIDVNNKVSIRTFQNIIKENNFYLPSCHRSTKKTIRKRLKALRKPKIYIELMEDLEEIKIERKYKRKYFSFGDTVEIDACQHAWYSDEKAHLYIAVDAGTGLVLVEHVEKEETSMGYIVLLKKLFKKWGKPRLIVADKRKSFWNGEENKSQISLILNQMDIEIITSSDPTVKPNVERSFKDAQQWLPLMLHLQKIKSIKEWNNQIDRLTKEYNKYFNKKRIDDSRSFLPVSTEDINKNLRLWIHRKVTNGNTVSINGEHYIPVKNNKRILFEDGAKITIFSNEKKRNFVIWRNEEIKLEVLSDKYIADYHSKEWDKISFEKQKQRNINKMLDTKMLKLKKKKSEVLRLINLLKKEKEQLSAL